MSPGAAVPARPSVLLIREWERQMSSSGCCGRLEGDFFVTPGAERCFPERRAAMEAMGPLYRDLRERYRDAVEVQVIDPRNLISLLPLLLRDFRAHGVGLGDALRTLFGFPVTGVIVNGRLVARGRVPEVDEVRAALGDGDRPESPGWDSPGSPGWDSPGSPGWDSPESPGWEGGDSGVA